MLAPERWARVRALLEKVVDLPLAERRTHVADACRDAPDVREEVESLLTAHEAAGTFLEPRPSPSDELVAPLDRTPLAKGTRLGCFEVISTLGVGGMGEVYRARDVRLDRDVALKVLLAEYADDPGHRERFEREARAISKLSHPHICVLHDTGSAPLGAHGERQFLVMELLDGETLAARLSRGALPVDTALSYATQIAEALAAAHSQEIVHRDLKPQNIMLTTRGVKLLDFGLARLHNTRGAAVEASGDPSIATDSGSVGGTLPYMSPEQVRGERIDARSDIFAFGAVLYEMLSGRRAFDAESRAELIAQILERQPPGLSNHHVSAAVDRLVATCLAKDRAERWQHAHDVVLALREIQELRSERTSVPTSRTSTIARWALAAAVILAVGWVAAARLPGVTPPTVPRQLMFDATPALMGMAWSPSLSRDGRHVAFLGAADRSGFVNFYVRSLDTGATRQLTDIKESGCGWGATWSYDGRSLLYLLSGRLRAVDLVTGSDRVLADTMTAPTTMRAGVTQSADGTIMIGGARLQILPPGQHVFRDVFAPHPAVTVQAWPAFLSNSREFVFAQDAADSTQRGVFLASLDSDRVTRILPTFSNVAVTTNGYLVYGRDSAILAQPFDAARGAVTGEPTVLASHIASVDGYSHFVADGGPTFVYVPEEQSPPNELVWYARDGTVLGKLGAPYPYRQILLSHDGRRLIVERDGYATPSGSLLSVMDVSRGTMQRVNTTTVGDDTVSADDNTDGVWSPDGKQFAFSRTVDNDIDLFVTGVNTSDRPTRLKHLPGMQWAEHWSKDGKWLLYSQTESASKLSVWALPMDGDGRPVRLVDSAALNEEAQLSPDGRWLVYSSDESGRFEIYVQPFGRQGQRWRHSIAGGVQPKWRADGRELYYLALDGTLMTASVGPNGEPGAPRALFPRHIQPEPSFDEYAVTPDGQRFLIITPTHSDRTARIAVISDWTGLLRR